MGIGIEPKNLALRRRPRGRRRRSESSPSDEEMMGILSNFLQSRPTARARSLLELLVSQQQQHGSASTELRAEMAEEEIQSEEEDVYHEQEGEKLEKENDEDED